MPSLVGAAASLMDLILPLICTNDQSPTETNKQTLHIKEEEEEKMMMMMMVKKKTLESCTTH